MPDIHPTAIVHPDATLHDTVAVGPYCIIDANVTLGEGTRLLAHVHLTGPLTLGKRNTLHPFVALGQPPQDYKYDPNLPGAGIVIGDDNHLREGVTIHR
ncbi:MAG: acyl-[acyl-carrier-protein]--UDP-N-acetylglucosamine O-acyltransferase, partial [Planctomycetota bacterium]